MPKFLDYDGLEHFYDKIVSSGGFTPAPTKTSTIRVTTSEADLLGCDVTVKISGHVYVQPFPETLTDGIAEVNIVVTELGVATVSATSVNGDEVSEAVDINAFYITAEVEFSLKLLLYKEGNEYESITGGYSHQYIYDTWGPENNYYGKTDSYMSCSGGRVYSGASDMQTKADLLSVKSIDLSKYTKLMFRVGCGTPKWVMGGYTSVSVGTYNPDKRNTISDGSTYENEILSVDISDIDSARIWFYAKGPGAYIEVYEIWAE